MVAATDPELSISNHFQTPISKYQRRFKPISFYDLRKCLPVQPFGVDWRSSCTLVFGYYVL
jgi:hypothetical protein